MIWTFEEAVGTLTMEAGTNPRIREAVTVLCREYDRVWKGLNHYADLSTFTEEEAEVARVALRRMDPPMGQREVEDVTGD